MAEFDSFIDPPSQAKPLLISVLITSAAAFLAFSLWYFLFQAKDAAEMDRLGQFAGLIFKDNPVFIAMALLATIVLMSGRER